MSIGESIKKVPRWGWIAAAGAGVGLYFILRSNPSSDAAPIDTNINPSPLAAGADTGSDYASLQALIISEMDRLKASLQPSPTPDTDPVIDPIIPPLEPPGFNPPGDTFGVSFRSSPIFSRLWNERTPGQATEADMQTVYDLWRAAGGKLTDTYESIKGSVQAYYRRPDVMAEMKRRYDAAIPKTGGSFTTNSVWANLWNNRQSGQATSADMQTVYDLWRAAGSAVGGELAFIRAYYARPDVMAEMKRRYDAGQPKTGGVSAAVSQVGQTPYPNSTVGSLNDLMAQADEYARQARSV